MLDSIVVFRKTGVVLWQQVWAAFKGADPVHAVIHTVLLEDRAGTTPMYQDANYSVKWAVDNEMEIVVAAVYQRVLPLTHVDELLERVRAAFVGLLRGVSEASRDDLYPCARFTKTFATLEADVEARAREARSTAKKTATPRTFEQSKKFANTRQGNKQSCAVGGGSAAAAANDSPSAAAAANGDGDDGASADGPAGGTSGLSEAQIATNIAKLKGGGPGAFRKKKSSAAVVEGGEGEAVGSEGKKKGKEGRSWDGSAPGEAKQTLDYSKKEGSATSRTTVFRGSKVDLDAQFGVGAGGDEDEEEEEGEGAELAAAAGSAPAKASGGGMFAAFRGLVGGKTLERADVAPLMETLLQKMIEKNVAQEIGEQICESVCTTLLGKQLGSFSSLRQTVRGAMDATLTRILTPSLRVDLLAGVERAQAEKRPYTIVFVGVNGVGKSTSVSKVAYYLKTNGFTPMLCACDTFRAGAVEQLRVHANALELPLFEKGYGKDASAIATDGIKHATQMGHDVVLVDTAGRMQDNEPLMRSLSKLVTLNSPDLVLFVGEALVGNEAVDQVSGFNQALSEYSASRQPRIIDGIMLTKFDTISDKVGAALSLVYTTGKPIVFVGVGQTYPDIRNLNVDHCVKALLRQS